VVLSVVVFGFGDCVGEERLRGSVFGFVVVRCVFSKYAGRHGEEGRDKNPVGVGDRGLRGREWDDGQHSRCLSSE
jgi:hypothetical protein